MSEELAIGLLMSHGHAYYRRILRGIAEFAEGRSGWRFVSTEHVIGPPVRALVKQVDAVIISIESVSWWRLVKRLAIPVVNVACVVPGLPIPRIGVNNDSVGKLAAQHFLERGLTSFAYVGHSDFLYSLEREQAFRSALQQAGYDLTVWHCDARRTYDNTGRMALLDAGVKRWLPSLPRPTGVLTAFDSWAADLLQYCHQLGIPVPEELAVLGVDDDDVYCEMTWPRLSSVIVPARTIGFRAAEELDRLIEDGECFMKKDLLIDPPGIVVRRSTEVLAIDDAEVLAAVRFIRENCHRQISVSDVLRCVSLSRRTLERRFVQAVGMTLGGEILRTRLERARRLLAETEMSMQDVAERSGFKDFRHLAVTFRHQLHTTPTQYRQSITRASRTRSVPQESGRRPPST